MPPASEFWHAENQIPDQMPLRNKKIYALCSFIISLCSKASLNKIEWINCCVSSIITERKKFHFKPVCCYHSWASASGSIPPASACLPLSLVSEHSGIRLGPLFRYWTCSSGGIFVDSSTGPTGCQTVRHSGILEKIHINPTHSHCKQRTRIQPAYSHCWWWKGVHIHTASGGKGYMYYAHTY